MALFITAPCWKPSRCPAGAWVSRFGHVHAEEDWAALATNKLLIQTAWLNRRSASLGERWHTQEAVSRCVSVTFWKMQKWRDGADPGLRGGGLTGGREEFGVLRGPPWASIGVEDTGVCVCKNSEDSTPECAFHCVLSFSFRKPS